MTPDYNCLTSYVWLLCFKACYTLHGETLRPCGHVSGKLGYGRKVAKLWNQGGFHFSSPYFGGDSFYLPRVTMEGRETIAKKCCHKSTWSYIKKCFLHIQNEEKQIRRKVLRRYGRLSLQIDAVNIVYRWFLGSFLYLSVTFLSLKVGFKSTTIIIYFLENFF